MSKIPALFVVLGILLTSAGLRLAADGPDWMQHAMAFVAPAQAVTTDPDAGDAEADAYLRALQRRDAELNAREVALDLRSNELASTADALRRQIAELERAEQQMRETLALATGAQDADVARMVSVYETMRAATAAPLFAAMEPSFAAGFLMRMAPEAAGAILSELPPERAYALSAVMAGRHGSVARQ